MDAARRRPVQRLLRVRLRRLRAGHDHPPADRTNWSAMGVVEDETEQLLRAALERAAADAQKPGADAVTQKLGDYYASCMDEAAIAQAGARPLDPLLALVARVKDAASAMEAVVALHAEGFSPFWDLGPLQDFADATQVIAALDQAGLGLPDARQYLDQTAQAKALRATYLGHIERMLTLLGWAPADATRGAAEVMKVETAIARLHQDEVFRRDPHHIYHRVDRGGLEKAAPAFPGAPTSSASGWPTSAP
ncbi:MAG: M13 family metallopeptidase N-terminal domain-containing protein [Myxococcota bacterium]